MVGNPAKDWKFDIIDCRSAVLFTGRTQDGCVFCCVFPMFKLTRMSSKFVSFVISDIKRSSCELVNSSKQACESNFGYASSAILEDFLRSRSNDAPDWSITIFYNIVHRLVKIVS